MTLGEKIKLLRTELEMIQPALAEKAGIEQSYLSKLENDKGSPSYDIINRIAMALGTTGMDLIHSLNQSYIEDHLAHIPEVAAEYENIRLKREMSQKKRFILASFLIVAGCGLLFAGSQGVFFPEKRAFEYYSEGIILDGEPDYLFDAGGEDSVILHMIESREEREARLTSLKDRLDEDSFVSYEYLGNSLIRDVEGGRRKYYTRNAVQGIERPENEAVSTIGILFLFSGIMGIAYSLRFRPRT